jgi:hypothetical protein
MRSQITMKRSLYCLPLALVLAAGAPSLCLAQDVAKDMLDECRKLAIEEEVAPEDMDDYIAECLAVIQSDVPEDAGDLEKMDAAGLGEEGEGAPEPTDAPTPGGGARGQAESAPPAKQ